MLTRDCTSWLMFSTPDPVHLFTIHLVLDTGRALEGTLPWLAVRSNGWLAYLFFFYLAFKDGGKDGFVQTSANLLPYIPT